MLVRAVHEQSALSGLGSIHQLVLSAGTSTFGSAVLASLQESVGVDSVIVFRFRKDELPEIRATSTRRSRTVLQRTSLKFVTRFSDFDPNAAVINSRPPSRAAFTRTGLLDINHQGYRDCCWNQSGVIDRCSYIGGTPDHWWALNLYRETCSGEFTTSDIDLLTDFGALLTPLTKKHLEAAPRNAAYPISEQFEQVVERCSLLTCREQQVCSRILRGLTTEAIALDLTIGMTSVITYRRRAYAKLGIATRHELLKYCMDRLSQ